jgi:protein TonB
LFDQTFVNTHAQTRRPWTVAASLTLQTALVAIAFVAPLLRVPLLQPPERLPVWLSVQPVSQPPAQAVKSIPRAAAPRQLFHAPVLRAPVAVPARIDMAPDAPELVSAAALAGPGIAPLSGIMPGIAIQPPAPEKPAIKPKPAAPTAPVRIGSGVQAAKLVFGPKPAYPPLALATRTQGTVKIQALIARDGAIRNLKVLSGPPLLIAAAIAAVQQWRYQPTLLNRQPVEVVTEIDINFAIGQ